ncbi:MAG: SusC/RagA family TonB-linked outer membrane protein, partial [Muribaculaceae bacterium]
IYGSRASNGVIIITTKKGRQGSKPRVAYNGYLSFGKVSKKYDVMTGDEYRHYVKNVLGQEGKGLGDANTDWQDLIYRTAISTDHQVSITGATKHMPYRVSLGYTDEQGIVKTSSFERFTAALNLSPSLFNDHLNINLSAKYMYAHNRYADGGVFGAAINADPTQPVYSDIKEFGGYWQNSVRAGYTDPNWIYTTNTNTPQNPVALLELKDDTAKSQSAIGNIEFDYKIHGFEDLHIHANVGGDYSEGRQTTVISPYSYSNNYYGWDGYGQSYKYNLQGNIYAQYIKEIGVHNIDVLVAAEEQHFNRKEFSEGQGWDPYAKVAKSPSLRKETEHIYTNTLVSYFGRVNYSLLDRYLLTATMRFDGSSRFSKDNRWGQFPAVGLAWKISEEKFLRNCNALDELKLRLGWGITGQQNIGYDFYYLPRYVTSNQYAQYTIGDKTYYTLRPEVYNSDLKWEKTTTYNAGLDWSFLKGRIDGSVEYYYRKTTDLISSVSVAAGTNFGNYLVKNIGSLRNYGIEASINARPIVTKDFTWQINYNVTWNDNKITKLTTGSDYALTGDDISAGLSNKVQVNKVGYPANSFYVYQQVYDEEGRPIEGLFVDRDGNGTIDPNDKYVYKKPTGDVTMGLTSKFIWKAWDFSFALRASFNNYLYYDFLSNKANVSWSGVYSNSAYNNTYADAVALGFQGKTNYYMSDYFIRNATFLRCDNINLGYSFNNLFRGTSYHGLSGRIYATVSNPFVITKYDGIDPERASGVDGGVYPRSTTYLFGLSLNF